MYNLINNQYAIYCARPSSWVKNGLDCRIINQFFIIAQLDGQTRAIKIPHLYFSLLYSTLNFHNCDLFCVFQYCIMN